MSTLTVFSPAKINLFLAITGRRVDGFHDLVSVVAPLAWGDTLRVTVEKGEGGREKGEGRTQKGEGAEGFSLTCDDPAVPVDGSNLVVKAAVAFAEATAGRSAGGGAAVRGVKFFLEKRIPIGAGLGGGSSNAAAALRALNQLAGAPLTTVELAAVAARVGSDCALFLHDGPVVMRGRGERVEPLGAEAAARLRGREVLVFKPAFGISTAWAYRRIAEGVPGSYLPVEEAERRVAAWRAAGVAREAETGGPGSAATGEKERGTGWAEARPTVGGEPPVEEMLFNNMEPVAFRKFPALPVLLERLREQYGLAARMSGSGSACFALAPAGKGLGPEVEEEIRRAWGVSALVIRTRFA